MQELWSRVLAGESNTPGTYSKRTVNFLSDLDKGEAEMFTRLCGFTWTIRGEIVPLIYDSYKHKIYKEHKINFNLFRHLESIGLIQYEHDYLIAYSYGNIPKKLTVLYYGTPVLLEMPKESDNEIRVGHVILTRIGQELAPICGSKPVDGFLEYIKGKWKELKYLPEDKTKQAKNTTNN
jgi:hypothetical protein